MDNEGYTETGSQNTLDKPEQNQIDTNSPPVVSDKVLKTNEDSNDKRSSIASFTKYLSSKNFFHTRNGTTTEISNDKPVEKPSDSSSESQHDKMVQKFGKKNDDRDESENTPTTLNNTATKLRGILSNLTKSNRSDSQNGLETSTNSNNGNLNNSIPNGAENSGIPTTVHSRRFAKIPIANNLFQKYTSKRDASEPTVETKVESSQVSNEPKNSNNVKAVERKTFVQSLRQSFVDIRNITKRKEPANENIETDSDTMCGAFGRYPNCLQRFATPRYFLVVFCLQNVLQGIASALFIGINTSLERHFHFSSQTIGSIIMFSEIGPIISSLVLSQLGGRGNRPRWMAFGQALSMLGLFLAFANNFIYPPPQISELSGDDSRKLCRLRDLLTSAVVPLRSQTASLRARRHDDQCFEHNQSAYFSWLLVHTLIGIGNSLVYSIGAPYLDDSIPKKNSPMYFTISFAVRILGPLLGLSLASGFLKIYVHPSLNPGINPSDPRWIGAWWIGFLLLALLVFFCSLVTIIFPRHLRDNTSKVDDKERGHARVKMPELEEFKVEDKTEEAMFSDANINAVKSIDDEITAGNNDPPDSAVEPRKQGKRAKRLLNFKDTAKVVLETIRRLLHNPVIMFSYIGDFFGMSAVFALYMWLPKYLEHHFRVSKSTSALTIGITGVSSLILGILGGGIYVQRCRPSARTITGIIIGVKVVYALSLIGLMHVDCGFHQDLPGVLSPDGQSIELYRGCSGGCECTSKEFIPVCVTDGPLQVTFFSPCHAGCYLPGTTVTPNRIVALTPEGEEIRTAAAAKNQQIRYNNCSCGSTSAEIKSGYCKDTCSGFMVFNFLHVTVNSFAAFGTIGGILISLRCVSEEDKAASMGLKSSVVSLAMLLNPIIFGSLFDSTCLLWEEACGKTGACWVYDTVDSGLKLFTSVVVLVFISIVFEAGVFFYVKDLKLFDEDEANGRSASRSFSSTLSTVFGMSSKNPDGNGSRDSRPSVLSKTFRRLSISTSLINRVLGNQSSPSKKDEEVTKGQEIKAENENKDNRPIDGSEVPPPTDVEDVSVAGNTDDDDPSLKGEERSVDVHPEINGTLKQQGKGASQNNDVQKNKTKTSKHIRNQINASEKHPGQRSGATNGLRTSGGMKTSRKE